jgi:SAM-dependent methyltransferase
MKRDRSPVEQYHDRVAGIYDTIYEHNPYWETVFALTWRHVLRHLPANQATRCLDVGCGTGKWGLMLLKSGYACDFLDISAKMLDHARRKVAQLDRVPAPPEFYHASLADLSAVSSRYDFIIGQGDPLGSAGRPEKALKELCRALAPGGLLLLSVDNVYGGMYHYLKEGDLDGLENFIKSGRTRWVTDEENQQYEIQAFTPEKIRELCAARRLEVVSIIGKTILPLRRFQEQLRDRETRERLIKLEEKLNGREAVLGCAAHLEFVARKSS